jgi:hypothetical protein
VLQYLKRVKKYLPLEYHGNALTVSRRHHVFMPCLWTVPRI